MTFFIFRILLILGFVYALYHFFTAKNNEKKKTKDEAAKEKEDDWSEF